MSVSYFVRYDVTAPDLPHFLEYYRRHHVPILARWPGIRSVVLHTATEWSDPSPVNRGGAVLLAQLEFDSAADLQAALASRERMQARRDFESFPPFDGTVTHQAMVSETTWRRQA